ncbi:MAG: hypothetical protein ACRCSM_08410 [Sediminibacterium sp.]
MFALLIGFTACQKDLSSDGFVLYTGNSVNDTVWTSTTPISASVNNLIDSTGTDRFVGEFNPTISDTLRSADGLEVSIPANTVVSMSGSPITDKVKLEINRLQTKGDIIRSLQFTTTDSRRILEVAGTFFIKASSGNQEVRIKQNGAFKIRFTDTADLKTNLSVFTAIESNPPPAWGIDSLFSWNRNPDTTTVKTWGSTSGAQGYSNKGYEFLAKNFRWISIGRYIDSSAARTKLSIILPPNYTNKNTIAFAVLRDKKSIIILRPDFLSRTFASADVPVNTAMTIVSISKIGDSFYLGNRAITDASSSVAFSITPDKKTAKQLIDFLNTL